MLITDLRTNRRHLAKGFLWLISALPLCAQQSGPVGTPQPNCLLTFQLPQSGQTVAPFNSPAFDNRFVGCTDFSVTVEVPTTISALSLVVQTAPDNGSGVPGTWSTFTAATGSNPNTLTTGWTATFSTGTSAYFAWLRVQLTSKTGTGQVVGKLRSSIAGPGSGSGSGGGCPGTVGTPCVVVGPIAQGADVSTTHPVVVQGIDYLNNKGIVPEVDTSTGGLLHQNVPNSLGDAIPNNQPVFSSFGVPLFMQVMPTVFTGGNGAGVWDRQFACTNQQNVTLTTIGLTRIITSNGIANKVRICSLSLSFASPVDVRLVEGTKVATDCDTGATNMTGLLRSVVAWDPPWSPLSALREQVAGNDVCVSMSVSVNGGGTVIYATF